MRGGAGFIRGFVHLHVHSQYSLRDSIIKADDLVDRLKEIGQDAVAITDHGMTLGAVHFYKKLTSAGIKYIHGCEVYVCENTLIHDNTSINYHLVLLCKNETGRLNLNRLITMSEKRENKYKKPRIDFNMLKKHKEGIIVLSACLAGELCRHISVGDLDGAIDMAAKYKREFGDDYYIELQSRDDSNQIEANKILYSIAQTLGIQTVITTDVHYVRGEDKEYQNKYAWNGKYIEEGEAYTDCFVQSEEEIRSKLTYLPQREIKQSMQNTVDICKKCSVTLPLSAPIMPEVECPPEFQSTKEWLHAICRKGFRDKLNIDLDAECIYTDPSVTASEEQPISQALIDTYIHRYYYELHALEKMGFIDYILLVYTYSNIGKRRGIARGSGGGSLINYLTNITNIDPVEHGLYFERFIDVGALDRLESGEITAKELKIPDIDLDFSSDSCKDVMQFIYDKYGETHVASIGKFGTNLTNGTIRDMCKVFGIDLETEDKIAKAFRAYEIGEIDQMISGEISLPPSAENAAHYVAEYPDLFRYVRKLIGLPKSFGLHACGKIISTRDLDTFLPSCYDDNGVRYLQGDMHDVEDVGLVKIDLLALRTLDQEFDTLEMSGHTQEFLDPRQDYGDQKVLDIFRKGDTVGIFQMSSYGMKRMLRQMKISGIDDIAVANALYRPGAIAYIDSFVCRRNGDEKYEYLHPDIEPILKNTYGILIYQEQLIEIGKMAGIHNPDILRKATGKKDMALLTSVKNELYEKLKIRGWTDEQFNSLWMDMLEFARYSFNKSHAYAYAIISYMTAKQKAYCPVEFYAGLCNSYIEQSGFAKESSDEIITDMYQHQIRMSPFSFRNDHRRCNVLQGRLVYAIPLIRGMNSTIADVLYQLRESRYQFFTDLLLSINSQHIALSGAKVGKHHLLNLIHLGFFSEYGNSRELEEIFLIVSLLNFGKTKRIDLNSKDIRKEWKEVIVEFSTNANKCGDASKYHTILNMDELLHAVERKVLSLGLSDYNIFSKLDTQRELLGFVPVATGKESDRRMLYVKEVMPLRRKSDGKQFGCAIVATSIGSGKQTRYSILNRIYRKKPIVAGDVIELIDYKCNNGYFMLTDYKVKESTV